MQVSIETTSGLERRLTVGVPAARVDAEVANRLEKAAKNVRIPGFRPGKVPMRVMRQRFGDGVRREVLGEVMSQSFREAIHQEKLRPAGQPRFEPRSLETGRDLEFVATFEVYPDVELRELAGFSIERPVSEVGEQDIDELITLFCKQQGSWVRVDRQAAAGDRVNIDYVGTRDGEAFDGGSAQGAELQIGSQRMIPGFEDGLIGMSAGDSRTLQLAFPEDYHNESLRGAQVEFSVVLNWVEQLEPAPLDEDLFAKYGVTSGGLARFREEVAQNMARELKNAVESQVKQQVMEHLLSAHRSLEAPKSLIKQEIAAMRGQMFQQFGGGTGQLDLDSLLPDEMFAENAERRVKLGLIMAEIITMRGFQVEPERVRALIEDIAASYENPQEVVAFYYGDRQQLSAVESRALEDRVVESLLEGAAVTDKPMPYREVVAKQSQNAQ